MNIFQYLWWEHNTLTSNKQSSERLIVSFSEFSPHQSYHIWTDVENCPPRADKIKIVSAVSIGVDKSYLHLNISCFPTEPHFTSRKRS